MSEKTKITSIYQPATIGGRAYYGMYNKMDQEKQNDILTHLCIDMLKKISKLDSLEELLGLKTLTTYSDDERFIELYDQCLEQSNLRLYRRNTIQKYI